MPSSTIDSFVRASRHPIVRNTPAIDFFQGALLGNGGLGAVVCTRPDAVVIHFGHNSVWDIRIAEDNREKIGTFEEVFARVKALWAAGKSLHEDSWLREYSSMAEANYRKSYPRPFPCGSVILGFDRREIETLGHRLDIATGVCNVYLLVDGEPASLQISVDMKTDRLWMRALDASGAPTTLKIDRIKLLPDPETPKEFPALTIHHDMNQGLLCFRQTLPSQEPARYDAAIGHPKDRAIRLSVRVNGTMESRQRADWLPQRHINALEAILSTQDAFVACVQLDQDLARDIPNDAPNTPTPSGLTFEEVASSNEKIWRTYWSQSGIALDDELLERTWYQNLYFLNCSLKPGVTCPGLFANWSYRKIGADWHGDYHMNYNTQQPFWVTFSSNHVDKHLPYVDLVDHLLPVSRKWAKEYYGLRGAYFPHSAYPVEMNMLPYPVPSWGWEICETPWTVQSLWWHFLYTQDKKFLADRAFAPIRDAVLFQIDYMRRPDARGERFGDDRYHVFPTVPPELYGLSNNSAHNRDCLVDLTLIKFVFHAYLKACAALERETEEAETIAAVRDVLAHFPDYPTAQSQHGTVFISAPTEHPEVIYNTPNSVMTVFPGEEHGLHSPPAEYAIAANSYRNHRNEGGNDLVFLNLQGARLGLLDLEKFKRQIEYCLLPNGTCTDNVLQVYGRYPDELPFDFMARMGIWFENFALPAVINECLMQSYNPSTSSGQAGELRLFPNWPAEKRAEFRTLRAAGAFLVSAEIENGNVTWIEITSEAGAPLRMINPWPAARVEGTGASQTVRDATIELPTTPGQILRFTPSA